MPDQAAAADEPVNLLLASDEEGLAEECRAISERIVIYTRADLDSRPELLKAIEVVYGWLPPAEWPQASRLRWVQITGAGVDSRLTPEVRASTAMLTNASGIHAEPITEHMFGMLLAYNRRLCAARDRQREGRWDGSGLGGDIPILEGKTLGLLGLGAIGTHSARVGRAFGMRVIGLRRTAAAHPDVDRVFGPENLFDFLSESDVVMNSLPLTSETRNMIDRREFAAMREGAVLINTGRGGTINTVALVDALQRGRPAAALLDVTAPEPLPAGHPLWKMENVMITPHYSGSHANYSARAARIFLDNLRRYLQGQPLRNVVDKEAGY